MGLTQVNLTPRLFLKPLLSPHRINKKGQHQPTTISSGFFSPPSVNSSPWSKDYWW